VVGRAAGGVSCPPDPPGGRRPDPRGRAFGTGWFRSVGGVAIARTPPGVVRVR
jgi:hypothetical protein